MPTLDRSKLGALTFIEQFDRPLAWWSDERSPPTGKRWRTGFEFSRWPGIDQIGSRFLSDEAQVYMDPAYRKLGINPFAISGDKLTITAAPTSPAQAKALDGKAYTSGLLTTAQTFQQVYGYLECRMKLPAGAGFWPAFWLYSFSGRTEIDVLECLTGNPRTLYSGAVFKDSKGGRHEINRVKAAEAKPVADLTADFHTYGVTWTPAEVIFYLDDVEQWRFSHTPPGVPDDPGFHEPMYMLVNLAVDGGWNAQKGFKATGSGQLIVEHLRAYGLT